VTTGITGAANGSICAVGTTLYVNNFSAGGHLASFNGSSWTDLGVGAIVSSGLTFNTVSGSVIYFAGVLASGGGISTTGLAYYDTSSATWAVASGGTQIGTYFSVSNNLAYGGSSANVVSVDLTTGTPTTLGTTSGGSSATQAVYLYGTDLYVGGGWATIAGIASRLVALYSTNLTSALNFLSFQTNALQDNGGPWPNGITSAGAITGSNLSGTNTGDNARDTGWTPDTHAWTYVSASSFKITGFDATAYLKKGTKIQFNQSGVKYATLSADATFSSDTTVNIIVNTDYTIANAAITAPYYSYQDSPQGWPDWYNYAPTPTGFTAVVPTNAVYRYKTSGSSTVTLFVEQGGNGTSNATTFTIPLPVTAATITNALWIAATSFFNNSAQSANSGIVSIASAATVAQLFTTWAGGTWTGSGGKRAYFTITYEF